MLDMLDVIESNSIDAIVTDPPYELNFMNKGWDNSGIAFQKETWEKCLKVLKPGGYLIAFGGSRTHHRIMCAIEDAGFEIRDMICWIFGSGFPKSMNIGLAIDKKNGVESELGGVKAGHQDFVNRTTQGHMKFEDGMSGFDRPWMHDEEKREAYHYQKLPTSEEAKSWQGWGTALKPSYEAIAIARKPCEGSCVENVMKYGVGGINIDECRVPTDDILTHGGNLGVNSGDTRTGKALGMFQEGTPNTFEQNPNGRFPANVILTYDETDFEEVCGGMPYTECSGAAKTGRKNPNNIDYSKSTNIFGGGIGKFTGTLHNDSGSAARYFYCAKASKRDRDEGLPEGKHNIHPTVKNTALMQYLIRLVTPKGGTVLDPFNGSGSTGKATMYENKDRNAGYKYIGIELTPEYLPIADARIRYAIGDNSPVEYPKTDSNVVTPKSVKSNGQLSLFDLH